MPSFALLTDKGGSLVSYVMHLSIRGNVELILMREYFMLGNDGCV